MAVKTVLVGKKDATDLLQNLNVRGPEVRQEVLGGPHLVADRQLFGGPRLIINKINYFILLQCSTA